MQDLLEICCGLDVHKETIVACLLKGTIDGNPSKEIRTFSTLLPDLEALKAWLEEEQCYHVAMESTGVYWHSVYSILEGAFNGTMVLIVANARHMKNVPGKKTDIKDSEWIATLLRAGLLRGSFIPSQKVRELRDLTRYRKSVVEEITSHKNRVEKYLQSSGFKLSTFLADIFGVSGRAIIEHIAKHGQINPEIVQSYVKGRARIKMDEIKIAVNGKMNKHQMDFLNILLMRLQDSEEFLNTIEVMIEKSLESFRDQINLIDGIPGINIVSASSIIAEIGIEMESFKTSQHICSWAGLAPGNNESAGKKKVQE